MSKTGLFILFVILNALDAALTYYLLTRGGFYESNGLLQFLAQGDALRIALVKAAGVVLVLALVVLVHRFRWTWALKWADIGLGLVVVWNAFALISSKFV